jgi:hypothetical protein
MSKKPVATVEEDEEEKVANASEDGGEEQEESDDNDSPTMADLITGKYVISVSMNAVLEMCMRQRFLIVTLATCKSSFNTIHKILSTHTCSYFTFM